MSITILLVLLVIFSFIGGHLLTRYVSKYVAVTGAEYLLVGVLIGPQVPPRLVTYETLSRFEPIIALLLGIVGFVVALHTRDALRSVRTTVIGVVSALLVLVSVAAVMLLLADVWVPVPSDTPVYEWEVMRTATHAVSVRVSMGHVWMALALGAAACVASPVMVDSAAKLLHASGPVTFLLRSSATLSQVIAAIVVGIAVALEQSSVHTSAMRLTAGAGIAVAVLAGIVCGLLFTLFIGKESSSMRILLATLGAVVFASGVGLALGLSPLFMNLVAGMTVALTSGHGPRLRDELDRLQHPLFVLVMIFAGALWSAVSGWVWLFPLTYIVVRYLARRIFTAACVRMLAASQIPSARIGTGLMAQGSMAVAVALDFSLRFPSYAPILLTTVLLGALLSDLWSARAVRALLLDAGESTDIPTSTTISSASRSSTAGSTTAAGAL